MVWLKKNTNTKLQAQNWQNEFGTLSSFEFRKKKGSGEIVKKKKKNIKIKPTVHIAIGNIKIGSCERQLGN